MRFLSLSNKVIKNKLRQQYSNWSVGRSACPTGRHEKGLKICHFFSRKFTNIRAFSFRVVIWAVEAITLIFFFFVQKAIAHLATSC
jgi:hypothetical protein